MADRFNCTRDPPNADSVDDETLSEQSALVFVALGGTPDVVAWAYRG